MKSYLTVGILMFLLVSYTSAQLDSPEDQIAQLDNLATSIWDATMVTYLHDKCAYDAATGLYTPYGKESAKRVANLINLACAHYKSYKAGVAFNRN